MKKLIAILLALMALATALAEVPIEPLPSLDTHETNGETIEIVIDGQRVALDFDASPQYSSVSDGLVQASFYKYSDDGATLWELYLVFPETVQPGMVITPDYSNLTSEESSVVLIASDTNTQKETYYFASIMAGSVYPEGSYFTISFDDIARSGGSVTYSGRLSANLVALDMASGAVQDTLLIEETRFSFTLSDVPDERHSEPLPTVLPDDMVRT